MHKLLSGTNLPGSPWTCPPRLPGECSGRGDSSPWGPVTLDTNMGTDKSSRTCWGVRTISLVPSVASLHWHIWASANGPWPGKQLVWIRLEPIRPSSSKLMCCPHIIARLCNVRDLQNFCQSVSYVRLDGEYAERKRCNEVGDFAVFSNTLSLSLLILSSQQSQGQCIINLEFINAPYFWTAPITSPSSTSISRYYSFCIRDNIAWYLTGNTLKNRSILF